MFDFSFYHIMSSWTWFRISLLFFQKVFDFFLFITSLFLHFHKNYYHITKGKEPAQSPKPAVSLPLNPSLLGHGSGLCPKNLPTSEIEVSSVSYEQIRVALFFFKIIFDFFLPHAVILNLIQDLILFFQNSFWIFFFITPRHPELDSGSTFIFSKGFWFFFFLFLLCFYFFHKNYYYFTKGKEPARSPKPAVSLPLNPFLLGHGSGLRPKNLPASEVSSVSCEQICVGDICLTKKNTCVILK